jgi:hypothetical protein
MGVNHVPHARVNLLLPFFAAENAIVPNTGLHMVRFHVGAQLAAQILRRHGLAHCANVIANEVSVGFTCENLVGAKSDMTYAC